MLLDERRHLVRCLLTFRMNLLPLSSRFISKPSVATCSLTAPIRPIPLSVQPRSAYSSTRNVRAICSSETSAIIYQIHITEESNRKYDLNVCNDGISLRLFSLAQILELRASVS
jgi:hypothetical protein